MLPASPVVEHNGMAAEVTELTQEVLNEMFSYVDGRLYWKRRGNKEAGVVGKRGYRIVGINYKRHMVHRLVWVMHGNEPVPLLDHIDGNKLNNRIENLRPATKSQNMMNAAPYRSNTSGIKGVSWISTIKRWTGQVTYQGKIYKAGVFRDKEECAIAVRILREKLHGEFARHA